MTSQPLIPQPLNLQTLPEDQARRLHDFLNARRAELLPHDPPIPFEERLKAWRSPPLNRQSLWYAALEGDTVLGLADADWDTDHPENAHIAWGGVEVAPEHRRRGVGQALLRSLLEGLLAQGRTRMFCATFQALPGGEPFVQRLGAKRGLEEHTNQLLLEEHDARYLRHALDRAPLERFELAWFDSAYPESEAELAALCQIFEVMNTAPRGDLEFNDFQVTPQQLRQDAEDNRRLDRAWSLLLVRDRESGRTAGFTEIGWHLNRPGIVHQYGTGVHPDFRGQGLGGWIKAAMLERVLRERPEVKCIRTGNADSNVPMLRINHGLGFKPFLARIEWQLEAQDTLERLQTQAAVLR